jgi:hypothetical protein
LNFPNKRLSGTEDTTLPKDKKKREYLKPFQAKDLVALKIPPLPKGKKKKRVSRTFYII